MERACRVQANRLLLLIFNAYEWVDFFTYLDIDLASPADKCCLPFRWRIEFFLRALEVVYYICHSLLT